MDLINGYAGGDPTTNTESMMAMNIRHAIVADAPGICVVLRRSIAELCVADHRNDPAILGAWLANKTPDNVAAWITNPANTMLVAVDAGSILAAGCVTAAGEVNLNYVSPDARFRGASRLMLSALEDRAKALGHARCVLDSTATALRFYREGGYAQSGAPVERFGLTGYPMTKTLSKAS